MAHTCTHARIRALHPNKREATVGKLTYTGVLNINCFLTIVKRRMNVVNRIRERGNDVFFLYSHFSQCVQIKLFNWLIRSLLAHDTSPPTHALQIPGPGHWLAAQPTAAVPSCPSPAAPGAGQAGIHVLQWRQINPAHTRPDTGTKIIRCVNCSAGLHPHTISVSRTWLASLIGGVWRGLSCALHGGRVRRRGADTTD
jgi:hypothetical protein